MRILVINQYYIPDKDPSGQLLASLCEGLAENGFQVDVICGMPSYTDDAPDAPAYEERSNLTVRRVATGGVKGRLRMRQRIQGYLGFLFSAVKAVSRQSRKQKYDAVLTLSNPPFVGLLGVWVKRFRGVRYIYVLHDIHPDILIHTNRLKPGIITWTWEIVNRIIFRFADEIVVLGSQMAQYLQKHKKIPEQKISTIPNWSLNELKPIPRNNRFRKTYNLGDSFVILYAGNMGILHNLGSLIEAAVDLSRQDIKFVLVGEGEQRSFLEKQVSRKQLDNVLFLPYQDAEMFNEMLCAADICVVTLEPELTGLAVPSKIYPILAAGRAILAITSKDDDVALLVREWQCGWVAQNNREVVEIIQGAMQHPDKVEQYGKQARIAHKSRYAKEKVLQLYVDLIKRVVNNRGALIEQG